MRCPVIMVGVTGFEPAASWSRTKRTTKLCHTPKYEVVSLFYIPQELFATCALRAEHAVAESFAAPRHFTIIT